jgi:hypothetical protein
MNGSALEAFAERLSRRAPVTSSAPFLSHRVSGCHALTWGNTRIWHVNGTAGAAADGSIAPGGRPADAQGPRPGPLAGPQPRAPRPAERPRGQRGDGRELRRPARGRRHREGPGTVHVPAVRGPRAGRYPVNPWNAERRAVNACPGRCSRASRYAAAGPGQPGPFGESRALPKTRARASCGLARSLLVSRGSSFRSRSRRCRLGGPGPHRRCVPGRRVLVAGGAPGCRSGCGGRPSP